MNLRNFLLEPTILRQTQPENVHIFKNKKHLSKKKKRWHSHTWKNSWKHEGKIKKNKHNGKMSHLLKKYFYVPKWHMTEWKAAVSMETIIPACNAWEPAWKAATQKNVHQTTPKPANVTTVLWWFKNPHPPPDCLTLYCWTLIKSFLRANLMLRIKTGKASLKKIKNAPVCARGGGWADLWCDDETWQRTKPPSVLVICDK